jgi:hypothetical protein
VAAPLPSGRPAAAGLWWTRRAMVAHAAILVWVPGCVVACWWQVSVALSGDSLGWVYSVMWPCFAVFGTIFWWHFVHDDPDTLGRRGLRRLQQATAVSRARDPRREWGTVDTPEPDVRALALAAAEAEDPELAAYNDYLAALAREGRPSTWRSR